MLSRSAIAAGLDRLRDAWAWTPDDVLVHGLPLSHVHGLVLGVLGALRAGSPLVHTGRPTPEAYAAAHGTLYFGVPTVWGRVAADASCAAAGATARLGQRWTSGTGATLFDGYLGRPESAVGTEGWFVTGDAALVDGTGNHRILGRAKDDLISSGGNRIGAGEIEAALLAHPSVDEAAVIGVPDDDLGQRIVAYVVCSDPTPVGAAVLIEHVIGQLPDTGARARCASSTRCPATRWARSRNHVWSNRPTESRRVCGGRAGRNSTIGTVGQTDSAVAASGSHSSSSVAQRAASSTSPIVPAALPSR